MLRRRSLSWETEITTTVANADGGERIMTLSQAAPDVVGEIADSIELDPRNGFHLEPRCRVCRDDVARKKVNDMLAAGASYAHIVRALGEHNAKCDRRDQVTIDSVRNHCARHFPVQNIAKATYRDILERRAEQNRVDFVNGVATALTPLAFFEIVMNKAFRNLVDDDTEVSVDIGLRAAEKLQSLLDKQDHGDEIAELSAQVNQIRDAVKAVVPQEMWGDIIARLDQYDPEAIDAETEDFVDEDPYDPTEFAEEDDDF
jgi:hypothetical protein